MKFWEVFFSTDKISYPIVFTIAFGVIIKLISLLFKLPLTDEVVASFMLIGFVLGNCIKTNKILDEETKKTKNNIKKPSHQSEKRKNIRQNKYKK